MTARPDSRDVSARESISEYAAFIATHPRDPLNSLLRETTRALRQQMRRRAEVRRLVGGGPFA